MKICKSIMSVMCFVVIGITSMQAYAQQNFIEFKTQAFKEIELTNEDGEKEYKLVAPGTALPRDEIIYIITFKNVSDQIISDIEITDPVPNDSLYKAGTAFGAGTNISFSADGGKTYAEPNQLIIKDNSGNNRVATAADYTHIRWIYVDALQPGAEGTVTFRTIIK